MKNTKTTRTVTNAPTPMKQNSGGEPILRCPRCNVGMKKLKNGNTIIDVCDSCGGMWLDKGEVEKLAARHPHGQ